MVAKCSNPACNCLFRELSKGRVFLLPPTLDSLCFTWSAGKLSDHCYWLCPECASVYTLEVEGTSPVVHKRQLVRSASPAA